MTGKRIGFTTNLKKPLVNDRAQRTWIWFTSHRGLTNGIRYRGYCFDRFPDFARNDKVGLTRLRNALLDFVIPSGAEGSAKKSPRSGSTMTSSNERGFSVFDKEQHKKNYFIILVSLCLSGNSRN